MFRRDKNAFLKTNLKVCFWENKRDGKRGKWTPQDAERYKSWVKWRNEGREVRYWGSQWEAQKNITEFRI